MSKPQPSDIPALLRRVEKLSKAVTIARGTSGQLIKAAPLELELYNLTTHMMNSLNSYRARLEDALGIYMRDTK